MSSVSRQRHLWPASLAALALTLSTACLRPPTTREPTTVGNATTVTTASLAIGAAVPAVLVQATSPQIPIDVHDAVWGNSNAPCTIVTFQDLQCPFCGKSWQTLGELEKIYGRDRLRVVYKHFPLPFHDDALPSARVAQAVFELKGGEAFRDFVSKVFELHGNLKDDSLRGLAISEGVANKALDDLLLDQNPSLGRSSTMMPFWRAS